MVDMWGNLNNRVQLTTIVFVDGIL
jgi:hypothetical protein